MAMTTKTKIASTRSSCPTINITTSFLFLLSAGILFLTTNAFSINHDIDHDINIGIGNLVHKHKPKINDIMSTAPPQNRPISPTIAASIDKINDVITTDAGGRGMIHLVVSGDLLASAKILARLTTRTKSARREQRSNDDDDDDELPHVVILSGFPCCVDHTPPTETDGPPGACAIATAALGLGYRVTLVTDECNEDVFRAAVVNDDANNDDSKSKSKSKSNFTLVTFPSERAMTDQQSQRLTALARSADLIIACERAGPASDGNCYTMRGINMNEKGLIAPLHRIVDVAREGSRDKSGSGASEVKFIAVGDGGNEMGMGKVLRKIREHIPRGELIGAVTVADHLIAASVSNWGGYALAAAAALVRCNDELDGIDDDDDDSGKKARAKWVESCVPTEESEVQLLERCVAAGCRDGVSGKMEATVDGMPLETSMKCLRDIREAALIP
ncbi:hypothetical protein ACHAXS_013820 [Conticribra weissflogii]